MREKYFCPNCSAVITLGERFCGNCGTSLKWVIPQALTDDIAPFRGMSSHSPGTGPATDAMPSLKADITKLLAVFEGQLREQGGRNYGGDLARHNQN